LLEIVQDWKVTYAAAIEHLLDDICVEYANNIEPKNGKFVYLLEENTMNFSETMDDISSGNE
jgi:hypothetical protein